MSAQPPFTVPDGRKVTKSHPIVQAILAKQEECRAAGLPYPKRVVDDFEDAPFVWWGRVAYDVRDLAKLVSHAPPKVVTVYDPAVIRNNDRLPNETEKSYQRYLIYRDLGPEQRSLTAVQRATGAAPALLKRAAERFRWVERAAAWDQRVEVEHQRAMQQALEEKMVEVVKRRETYLENEWQVVERGFAVVKEMLKFPLIEQESRKVSDDGKITVTVWKPGRWTYAAMASLMEALTKIGRLNIGLATSNTSVKTDLAVEDRQQHQQPTSPDEEAMHRYASQQAEEAYFNACEEWKSRHAPTGAPGAPLTAHIVGG